MKIVDLIVDSDELVGGGGFLQIRRLRMRNRREDGSASQQYCADAIHRPYGQDAVIVAVFARQADGTVNVLLREGMRPQLPFGRDAARAPLPEPPPSMWVTELVAGIVENGDVGEAGLRIRAAAETREEGGFVVAPEAIVLLGAGSYPAPGTMFEKFYFTAVEVDPSAQLPLTGDDSPMEEGATTRWLSLDRALADCETGTICDLKTEVGLRRLRDHLAR